MVISIWRCESGSFALQNLRFYRAKQPPLQHVDKEMITQEILL